MKKKISMIALCGLLICGMSVVTANTIFPQDEKKEVKGNPPVEKGKITIDKTEHDFGTISEDGGEVTTVFTLRNNMEEAILINGVHASCGCTTPTWTKEPIEPGKTGEIVVSYNPKGRPGSFHKGVTIITTGEPLRLDVYIKGNVE
jgi:Protein of unknown function (DUF1573).